MKIRIQGNSLRLRLMQGEVSQLKNVGQVEEHIVFSPDNKLTYLLKSNNKITNTLVSFSKNVITVSLPLNLSTKWVDTDQVSIDFSQKIDTNQQLSVLIEKDFKCLTDRPSEDESDAFPNPNQHC